MLQWEQTVLADRASVSVETIKRLERLNGDLPAQYETLSKIHDAFERAGIRFVEYGEVDDSGAGVRFALTKSAQLENAIVRSFGIVVEDALRNILPNLRDKTIDLNVTRDAVFAIIAYINNNPTGIWNYVTEDFDFEESE